MATVNFSVPDDIKKRFNEVFGNQNKSHIISELMKHAIEEEELKLQRSQAIDELLKLRSKQKIKATKTIQTARNKDRN